MGREGRGGANMVGRKTIYMLKESGGAIRANDPRVIPAFERVGFRKCTKEEYQAMQRSLSEEERRECNG